VNTHEGDDLLSMYRQFCSVWFIVAQLSLLSVMSLVINIIFVTRCMFWPFGAVGGGVGGGW